jgi:hypothetical protein
LYSAGRLTRLDEFLLIGQLLKALGDFFER